MPYDFETDQAMVQFEEGTLEAGKPLCTCSLYQMLRKCENAGEVWKGVSFMNVVRVKEPNCHKDGFKARCFAGRCDQGARPLVAGPLLLAACCWLLAPC